MNLTGTQLTIIICIATIVAGGLVALGKLTIPASVVERAGLIAVSFLGGLVLPRPNAVRTMLGLPVRTPPVPITYTDDGKGTP